jgi:hypothetical protein
MFDLEFGGVMAACSSEDSLAISLIETAWPPALNFAPNEVPTSYPIPQSQTVSAPFPLLFLLIIIFFSSPVWSSECTHYASPNGAGDGLSLGSPFSVQNFWTVASPGKTLCLLNGTYQGAPSMIAPPAGLTGTSTAPITVRALNDGGALIDAQFARCPVDLSGVGWFTVEGVNAKNAGICDGVIAVHGRSHNITVRRAVAWDAQADRNNDVCGVHNTSGPTLFEDVACFGMGRKTIDNTQGGNNFTCRRCWGRWEGSINVGPKQTFSLIYNSYGFKCENCIGRWSGESMPASFTLYNNSTPWPGSPDVRAGTYTEADQAYGIFSLDGIKYGDLCASAGFYGSAALLFGTDFYNSDVVTFLLHDSCIHLRHVASVIQPGYYANVRPFGLYGAAGMTDVSGYNLTGIGAMASEFKAPWVTANVSQGANSSSVANPWTTTGAGANLCYRWVNGVQTNQPLWPWPMNERIKAATASAGAYNGPCPTCVGGRKVRTATDVTNEVQSLLGTIPSQCRSTSPAPTPAPSASVSVSATQVIAGAPISVTVKGGPGNVEEWVAIYLASDPDSALSYNGNWMFLNGSKTMPSSPLPSGTKVFFTAPLEPGVYNIRYFATTGTGSRLAVSGSLTVTAPPAAPVDTTPPTVTIISPANGTVVRR